LKSIFQGLGKLARQQSAIVQEAFVQDDEGIENRVGEERDNLGAPVHVIPNVNGKPRSPDPHHDEHTMSKTIVLLLILQLLQQFQ
jgi:hypothetical protein